MCVCVCLCVHTHIMDICVMCVSDGVCGCNTHMTGSPGVYYMRVN